MGICLYNREFLIEKNYMSYSKRETAQEFIDQFGINKQKWDQEYPLITINNDYCAFITQSDIVILAIFSQDLDLISVYQILYTLIQMSRNAFNNNFDSQLIKNNYSNYIKFLGQYLDYGYPLIIQPYVLEGLLRPAGFMDKMSQLSNKNDISKSNLKYVEKYADSLSDYKEYSSQIVNDLKLNEEIYFDIVEYLDQIVDENGNTILNEINAEIKIESQLTGVNNIKIYLQQSQNIQDYSIHQCLHKTYETLEQDGILSFICPTGSFSLINYKTQCINQRIPFEIIHHIDFTNNEATITIKIESRPVRGVYYNVENLYLKLLLPNNVTQQYLDVTNGSTQLGDDQSSLMWRMDLLKREERFKLQAKFKTDDDIQLQNQSFILCLKYIIMNFQYSDVKIEKVDIQTINKVKPVKKARSIAKSGYFEIRMN